MKTGIGAPNSVELSAVDEEYCKCFDALLFIFLNRVRATAFKYCVHSSNINMGMAEMIICTKFQLLHPDGLGKDVLSLMKELMESPTDMKPIGDRPPREAELLTAAIRIAQAKKVSDETAHRCYQQMYPEDHIELFLNVGDAGGQSERGLEARATDATAEPSATTTNCEDDSEDRSGGSAEEDDDDDDDDQAEEECSEQEEAEDSSGEDCSSESSMDMDSEDIVPTVCDCNFCQSVRLTESVFPQWVPEPNSIAEMVRNLVLNQMGEPYQPPA